MADTELTRGEVALILERLLKVEDFVIRMDTIDDWTVRVWESGYAELYKSVAINVSPAGAQTFINLPSGLEATPINISIEPYGSSASIITALYISSPDLSPVIQVTAKAGSSESVSCFMSVKMYSSGAWDEGLEALLTEQEALIRDLKAKLEGEV